MVLDRKSVVCAPICPVSIGGASFGGGTGRSQTLTTRMLRRISSIPGLRGDTFTPRAWATRLCSGLVSGFRSAGVAGVTAGSALVRYNPNKNLEHRSAHLLWAAIFSMDGSFFPAEALRCELTNLESIKRLDKDNELSLEVCGVAEPRDSGGWRVGRAGAADSCFGVDARGADGAKLPGQRGHGRGFGAAGRPYAGRGHPAGAEDQPGRHPQRRADGGGARASGSASCRRCCPRWTPAPRKP